MDLSPNLSQTSEYARTLCLKQAACGLLVEFSLLHEIATLYNSRIPTGRYGQIFEVQLKNNSLNSPLSAHKVSVHLKQSEV